MTTDRLSRVELMDEVRLQATNFQSFSEIAAFRAAIQAIPGVTNVRLTPTGHGTVQAVLTHQGVLPFEVYLKQLMVPSSPKRIPAHVAITVS